MEARCTLFISQSDEDILNHFARGAYFHEFRVATVVRQNVSPVSVCVGL